MLVGGGQGTTSIPGTAASSGSTSQFPAGSFFASADEPNLTSGDLVATLGDNDASVRRAAAGGKSLARFVEPLVAEYIKKMGLYKASAGGPG